MKLYITGPVASGKSTLARRIAAATGVPCYHLDDVRYEPLPGAASGNRKRPAEEREALFNEICGFRAWIMEDAGRVCFSEGMRQADELVLLEPPLFLRRFRILRRWLRQRRGLEACSYRPNAAMLRDMYRWTQDYKTGDDDLRQRIAPLREKTVVLRTRREIEAYLAVKTAMVIKN